MRRAVTFSARPSDFTAFAVSCTDLRCDLLRRDDLEPNDSHSPATGGQPMARSGFGCRRLHAGRLLPQRSVREKNSAKSFRRSPHPLSDEVQRLRQWEFVGAPLAGGSAQKNDFV